MSLLALNKSWVGTEGLRKENETWPLPPKLTVIEGSSPSSQVTGAEGNNLDGKASFLLPQPQELTQLTWSFAYA